MPGYEIFKPGFGAAFIGLLSACPVHLAVLKSARQACGGPVVAETAIGVPIPQPPGAGKAGPLVGEVARPVDKTFVWVIDDTCEPAEKITAQFDQ